MDLLIVLTYVALAWHFLTEFPGWSINSPPRKRLTIPRSRRSNYGSIDCFNLRGAGVDGL